MQGSSPWAEIERLRRGEHIARPKQDNALDNVYLARLHQVAFFANRFGNITGELTEILA